jgi:hypothetical protein
MNVSMKDLTRDERLWLAKSVVAIILADNDIEASEMKMIKKISQIFMAEESKESITLIGSYIKNKQVPKIEDIKVSSPDHVVYMLSVLAESVFADNKKHNSERDCYFEAGQKMGLGPGTLAYRLSLEYENNRVQRKLIEAESEILEDIRKRF